MALPTIDSAAPHATALYIHWPFCRKKCPYCDFNSHVREAVDHEAWAAALLAELRYWHARVPGAFLTSIFFGGGTPSLMEPSTAASLITEAKRLWTHGPDLEITLEANPTSVEAGKFRALRDAGVNRLSLGIQSLRPEALKFLGRQHSADEAHNAIHLARDLFPRHSFDLIYALPNQSVAQWEEELRAALALTNGHLSLYQLTIEENTAFHHTYHVEKSFALPDETEAAEFYSSTQRVMEEAGLPAYEISNHSRPGEESCHNLAYWRSWPYFGIGPGAHGRVDIGENRLATRNLKSPERWLEAVQKNGHGTEEEIPLTPSERAEEKILMGLRLREGIPYDDFLKSRAVNIEKLHRLGLLQSIDGRLRATHAGTLVLNRVISELLA